jgi:LacI family transcriptional regulator, gluconate utilization system Gnt-I transcriptional repressor
MSTTTPRKSRASSSGSRMEDVAALAGVSMITVSRVLNTPDKVTPATRDAVLAAIKKTGYVPNLMAGGLASNKSRIVGAIVPTIDNSIFADTVRGLSDTLAAQGYQLLLGQSNYDLKTEESLVATFMGRRVDGLVLTGAVHSTITTKRLRQGGIPVVETWDLPKKPIDMVAGFSNFEAGRAVGQYLLDKGWRKLCFAGGPDDRSAARLEGLRSAVDQVRGAAITVESLPAGAAFAGGRKAVVSLLQNKALPDAIFFGNDALAAGAVMECLHRNIAVPSQLAIFGFSDLDVAAAMEPALTSIRVPTREMGEVAATMLLARLKGEPIDVRVRDLGFSLMVRQSA